MIWLRQSIERGMRRRWLGPVFVILLVLLLAMTALHAIHDGDHVTEGAGEFYLGLAVVFSFVLAIRLSWRAQVPVLLPAVGRGPPLPASPVPRGETSRSTPVPLRL